MTGYAARLLAMGSVFAAGITAVAACSLAVDTSDLSGGDGNDPPAVADSATLAAETGGDAALDSTRVESGTDAPSPMCATQSMSCTTLPCCGTLTCNPSKQCVIGSCLSKGSACTSGPQCCTGICKSNFCDDS